MAALVCAWPIGVQAVDAKLTQWVHDEWQTDRGLPQNSVFCLAQDHEGFLWLGTEHGLARFDGVEFRVYNRESTPPTLHEFVSTLFVARDGNLWAGTRSGGLVRYREGRFEAAIPELAEEDILAMAETAEGLWFGTRSGLARYAGGTLTYFKAADGLPAGSITALRAGKDGSLWIGSGNGELAQLKDSRYVKHFNDRLLHRTAVLAIAEDPRTGDLWIGHDGDGLFRMREGAFHRVDLLGREFENIQALHVDAEGSVWCGTQYSGLIRYKEGQLFILNAQLGLKADDVIALFEDKEGSIWAGTLFGGLHRLHQGKVVTFGGSEGLPADTITSLAEPTPNMLWVGTKSNGLFQFAEGKFEPLRYEGMPSDIRSILRSQDGDHWIGGNDVGLLRCSTNGTKARLTTMDGLAANDVSALFQDKDGEIWVGSQRDGISIVDPGSNRVVRKLTDSFLKKHARCFAQAGDGTIWIGTQDGLVKFRDGKFEPEYLSRFPRASIRSLWLDSENTLWIATRDDGLLRLRRDVLFQFGAKTGVQHTRIYQLLSHGPELWIAGNRGIEKLRWDQLAAVAEGKQARLHSELLTERHGLRTMECTADASPTAIADTQGTLWFGTRRGLSSVPARGTQSDTFIPKVVIERVRLDNHPVSTRDFKIVPAGTTRLQFKYTAPALRNGPNVLFRYKLEGVDKQWFAAGREREAVYYHLKPGGYRFKVSASKANGLWPNTETMLAFQVAPHFYQTAWFYGIVGVLGAGGMRGLYRWRVSDIQRRNRMLKELVEERTRELEGEVAQRRRAEEKQIALNADLESRVEERTGALTAELRERGRIEKELAASEARFRRVVDCGMVGIHFWKRSGRIVESNDTFLKMIGRTREELMAGEIRWDELTPPEFAELDQNALEEITQRGVCTPFEKEYFRKDGSRCPILIGGATLTGDHNEGVCFVLDISERKASEEQVRLLAQSLEARVQERTVELARINEQLANEVQERKRVAVALSAFSQLGQKLHSARTEKEAANIIALAAKSLIPHDRCSIDLYGRDDKLYPVIQSDLDAQGGSVLSSISVSIRNGSRVIGVIGLQSSSADAFRVNDANTLQALGDYCGGALDRIHAEEARRETERRFSAFMANAPALAWMKDAQLRYVFTNRVFQQFLGLSAEEIDNKSDDELWPAATAEKIRANDRQVFERDATIETYETLRRADEESRTLLTFRFPFTTANGEKFVAGMALDVSEQKRAEEALHHLPQRILEAHEQERRRLARELHDGVNQGIASVKFRIQTAENQIVRGDPKWQETCLRSKQMLDTILKQVRQLSHNLRPGELDDLGLVSAARTAFHEFEARTGANVHFTEIGLAHRLPPELESTLYRIIQESLTNTEKHSQAKNVEVYLRNDTTGVTLEISDDGLGFDANDVLNRRTGLGLLHMRERASLAQGSFSIQASPGQGVRITVQIPHKDSPNPHA